MTVDDPQERALLSLPPNQLPERHSIGATKAFSFLPRKCRSCLGLNLQTSFLLVVWVKIWLDYNYIFLFSACFVQSSSPRPVVVEPLEQFDDEDGLPEKLAQKNPRYQAWVHLFLWKWLYQCFFSPSKFGQMNVKVWQLLKIAHFGDVSSGHL